MSNLDKSIRQTARICNIPEGTLRKLVSSGDIPHSLSKNGDVRLNISSISAIYEVMRKRSVCFYPKGADPKSVEVWLSRSDDRVFEIHPYSPDSTGDYFLNALEDFSPYCKVILLHPHTISRDALSAIAAASSRNQSDLLLMNSLTLS